MNQFMSSFSTLNIAWVDKEEVFVRARYSEAFVEDCRQIEGRRWDSEQKVNVFPVSQIPALKMLAEKWNIRMPKEVISADDGKYFTNSTRNHFQVTVDGDEIVICFDYNPRMIEAIRMFIPGVKWNANHKEWRCAITSMYEAVNFAVEYNLSISKMLEEKAIEVLQNNMDMREASMSLDAEIEIPDIALPLMPYQKAGVAYMKKVRKGIIGDQPGLGKTAQAIATVASENAYPVVVVCPNTLKFNWQREIQKFFPKLRVSILSGTKSETIEETDVIIVNYDICYERNGDMLRHGFNSLIVDESHAIKNGVKKTKCPLCNTAVRSNATRCNTCGAGKIKPIESWTVKRTGAVMQLAKSLDPQDFVILLTGTPITNRPDELIPQLEAVGHLASFGGSWRFKNRYAPKRNVALNTAELNVKLRELCFVRRNKKDVYEDLPELRNAVQYLPIDSKQMNWYQEVERDVVEYFANRAKELAEEDGSDGTDAYWQKKITLARAENLVKITALRDAVSKIKYDSITAWLDNFLESGDGEKVIVFAEHIEFVEKLFDRYKSVAVKIRGGVSADDRMAAVDKFQSDPDCRVFIANMTAASEGLTLTAASDVVFCELGWTPAIHEQCVSRCYARANDMHGATAWYLLAQQTIDETIYNLLENKKKVVNAVTDGVDVEEGDSVMGGLIKDLAERGLSK